MLFPWTWDTDGPPGGTLPSSLNHFLPPPSLYPVGHWLNEVPWGTVQVDGPWCSTQKSTGLRYGFDRSSCHTPLAMGGQSVHSGGRREATADEGSVDIPALVSPDCLPMAKSQPEGLPRSGPLADMSLGHIPGKLPLPPCLPGQVGCSDSLVPAWHHTEEETQNQRGTKTRLSLHSRAPRQGNKGMRTQALKQTQPWFLYQPCY